MSSAQDFEIPSVDAMRRNSEQAGALLKTLGNPDRLLILCQINRGEICVSDLEAACDVSQPTLSQQLTVLRAQGLVKTRREGKRVYYSLASPAASAVLMTLYQIYCHGGSDPPGK
ncbi:transcriptional regulator, ArsR family [Thiomonas bhubaneswarensis]|uniref:Transcriptional regulator, ArsR family n=2 Tax=Thiomonas bhubaneswarensis TaxID=339866 RepID=A0A0K6I230_9BURK|nr:metalloregulator ArsR/SmtB family transcription factor [Thiomonas bhubaneswarensis]CUA97204.1 transcriptional regulator, ArsR family [Thiomonas bhubaneswarensis]